MERQKKPIRKDEQHVDEQHIFHHAEHSLWIRVLEKQGFATLFGIAMLWGGYRIGEAHVEFLKQQMVQMNLQTGILAEIARSNKKQEETLNQLQGEFRESNDGRAQEHEIILDEMKKQYRDMQK